MDMSAENLRDTSGTIGAKVVPRGKPFTGGEDPRRWANRTTRPSVHASMVAAANKEIQQDGITKSRLDALIEVIFASALRGSLKAAEIIFDRLEGKAKERIELDTMKGQPELGKEERQARIRELFRKMESGENQKAVDVTPIAEKNE